MNDCLFCKIVAGDIPSSKVYEDEDVLAFLGIGSCCHFRFDSAFGSRKG